MTQGPAPDGQPSTLELHEATFRRAGATLLAALSVRSNARRIGLVGDWEPLFRTLTGDANISSGSAQIFGCELGAAIDRGIVGFAACDPALPASLSVRDYLQHAARLSHGSHSRATSDARRTLDEYGLTELASLELAQLVLHQRRALGIACAALTAPPVLVLEAPLRDLDAASASYVARLCTHAGERSQLIVSSGAPSTPSAERALLDECDELFLLQRGALVAHGPPNVVFAAGTRYLLTLAGQNGGELSATLEASGCQLSELTSPTTFQGLLTEGRHVCRYCVELPNSGSPDLLLDAALAAGMTVLELEPVPPA